MITRIHKFLTGAILLTLTTLAACTALPAIAPTAAPAATPTVASSADAAPVTVD